jgi:glucose-6-phosphate isomerase
LYTAEDLGFSLDISRMDFDDAYLTEMDRCARDAVDAMSALDRGAAANVDEVRMVGHYWLRAPELAPSSAISRAVTDTRHAVAAFAEAVRGGHVRGADGPFLNVVHVGIGGSALGPQLLCGVLGDRTDGIAIHFLDNADPDGIDTVLGRLHGGPGRTLVSVVSKSGVTPTPLLVLHELEKVYRDAGLDLRAHAVATTMADTDLDKRAKRDGWLARFPLWDWIGGRTSITSAVGLLPAAILGGDIAAFLDGAAAMDRRNRQPRVADNPAVLLALMWFWAGAGRGTKNMVVLPYKDRLALLPRYVQQLVMESIGKRHDRRGRVIRQGLTVYGHKGSTDQHAYLQQLRDGPADFFVTFVRVRQERSRPVDATERSVTLGDYLFASSEATRDALYSRGRESITITLPDTSLRSLGALVALFERATGIYAELIDVNAYHQPGVDKYVAAETVELQRTAVAHLGASATAQTAEQVAAAIGHPDRAESVFKVLENLAALSERAVVRIGGTDPGEALFSTCVGTRVGSGDGPTRPDRRTTRGQY